MRLGDTWPIEVPVVHSCPRTVLCFVPWKARKLQDVAPAEFTFLVIPPVFITSPSKDRREEKTCATQDIQ